MTIYEATITKPQKLPESLVQKFNQFIESLTRDCKLDWVNRN
ncbi:hypothetical protein Syn7502_02031 [Synechococcus sp. PCC 7502]|nr:hypothetical protein [Synechococcus sp. PCC 7502]AFY74055.1 hypothetical protein Syn7502_02031 [Synechococcus sp. PCC 7502]